MNVYGMRALLQHRTVDIHKLEPLEGWEGEADLYECNEESDGDNKGSGDTSAFGEGTTDIEKTI